MSLIKRESKPFPKGVSLKRAATIWSKMSGIEFFDDTKDTVDKAYFDYLVALCLMYISTKSKPIDANVFRNSLSHLLGKPMQRKQISQAMKFLCYNYKALQRGQTVLPVKNTDELGMCVLQFEDMKREGEFIDFTLRVVYGPAYGTEVHKRIKAVGREMNSLMYRLKVGTQRRLHGTPRDLIQLYLFADIRSSSKGFTFYWFEVPPYLGNLNREKTKARDEPCMYGYTRMCSGCDYTIDQCERATRRVSLTVNSKEFFTNANTHQSGERRPHVRQ